MTNRRTKQMPRFWTWLGDMEAVRLYLGSKAWLSPWGLVKLVNAVLRCLGVVAFANNPLTGALILTAMFLGNSDVGVAALMAGVVAVVGSKLLGAADELVCDGVTVFNSVLVGCISTVVTPEILGTSVDLWHWIVLAAAFIITCYVDVGINALMAPSRLSAQSIPFNVVTAVGFLAARGRLMGHGLHDATSPIQAALRDAQSLSGDGYTSWMLNTTSEDVVAVTDVEWLKVMEGSVLAAGQVYGVGTMIPSILIWLGFILYSPILSSFFFIGSFISCSLACFLVPNSLSEVYVGLWSYNSLLTAGGISYFLAPTHHMFVAAIVGSVMSVVTQAAIMPIFLSTQVPVLSFPFNIVITILLAISTQKGTSLRFLDRRTYNERHVYELYCCDSQEATADDLDLETALKGDRYLPDTSAF